MFFEVKNLRKWFGGVKAVDGVSLSVNQGEICSVIGPNGAGKTTLFNLITGFIRPDSGEVIFLDEDVTGKSPKLITERGIARSFQIVNIFPRLTVYENIMVAVLAQQIPETRRPAVSWEPETAGSRNRSSHAAQASIVG